MMIKTLQALYSGKEAGKWLVFFLVLAMFLPRHVKKGMFGDGLLYASMARNMAEGRGSIWKPFFSSSYWLPDMPTTYYENPPLMLWSESLFFTWFGDYWWVEKLFCVLILVINICLFKYVWCAIFKNQDSVHNYWYLSVFWWYLIPVVIWGNVNNLMDSMLLSWCLGSIYFLIKALHNEGKMVIASCLLAGICVLGGILTKGPVALYPLALPVIFWLVQRNVSLHKVILITLTVGSMAGVLFLIVVWSDLDAAHFFRQYWEQRLKAVITGSRNDMILLGWERFYILKQLVIELSPMAITIILGAAVVTWKGIKIYSKSISKMALTFALLGFAATLPILISSKQSGIYLLPGIPMFAIAAGIFTMPVFHKIGQSHFFIQSKSYLKILSALGIMIVLIISVVEFGKPGREKTLIHDVELMIHSIPPGSKIGVSPEMKKDFMIHTYMQRMGKYELMDFKNDTEYFCTYLEAGHSELALKYETLPGQFKYLKLYYRK